MPGPENQEYVQNRTIAHNLLKTGKNITETGVAMVVGMFRIPGEALSMLGQGAVWVAKNSPLALVAKADVKGVQNIARLRQQEAQSEEAGNVAEIKAEALVENMRRRHARKVEQKLVADAEKALESVSKVGAKLVHPHHDENSVLNRAFKLETDDDRINASIVKAKKSLHGTKVDFSHAQHTDKGRTAEPAAGRHGIAAVVEKVAEAVVKMEHSHHHKPPAPGMGK